MSFLSNNCASSVVNGGGGSESKSICRAEGRPMCCVMAAVMLLSARSLVERLRADVLLQIRPRRNNRAYLDDHSSNNPAVRGSGFATKIMAVWHRNKQLNGQDTYAFSRCRSESDASRQIARDISRNKE